MIKSYLNNPARILQLFIGTIAVVSGFFYHDYLMVFLGGWILMLSLLNKTCCGSSLCGTLKTSKNKTNEEETTYTEIK